MSFTNISTLILSLLVLSACSSIKSSHDPFLWEVRAFEFPKDDLSCNGRQFVQFNDRYGKYVGITQCNDGDEFRIYMSSIDSGRFLPVTDTAGHGQDHCELINKNFALPNEDSIKSGGCTSCDTSRNLPLENVDTWSRSRLGTQFLLKHSGTWSYQTSRLKCGVVFENCGALTRLHLNTVCDARVIDGKRQEQ
jgi:hypothetical protein